MPNRLAVFIHSWALYFVPARRAISYEYFRKHRGRIILLGLEVLVVSDIIRTIIVNQTLQSVAVLATIVVVRIVLSWSLFETNGLWPWKKGQADGRIQRFAMARRRGGSGAPRPQPEDDSPID